MAAKVRRDEQGVYWVITHYKGRRKKIRIGPMSGRSNVTENLIPERVVSRAWLRTFRLALLDKDIGIALKVLKDTGVPSDAIGMTKRVFGLMRLWISSGSTNPAPSKGT